MPTLEHMRKQNPKKRITTPSGILNIIWEERIALFRLWVHARFRHLSGIWYIYITVCILDIISSLLLVNLLQTVIKYGRKKKILHYLVGNPSHIPSFFILSESCAFSLLRSIELLLSCVGSYIHDN